MDVNITFINGVIEEEVYIEKPQGLEVHGNESHVCRLNNTLYGFKQASKAWYARIDNYLTRLRFSKRNANSNLSFSL